MKSNNKLKLLYLAQMFERKTDEEHTMTIQDIIEYLADKGIKAERKSLYTDIALLRDFGYDIIGEKTNHFEYYLASRAFEDVELKLLVDAVQSSRFITKRKSGELIKKLEGLSSEYGESFMDRQVYVANRIKNSNESIYYNVVKIHRAIGDNKNITFKYFDITTDKQKKFRHDGMVYCVSPWSLSWNDEYYYLIAYDTQSKKIKHYRVDKMMYIAQTNEAREGKEQFSEFDLPLYSKRFFGMFDGEVQQITIECSTELAGVVFDRFGYDIEIFNDNGKMFSFKIDVAISDIFYGWVMSFGDKLKVVAPESVKKDIREYITKISSQY